MDKFVRDTFVFPCLAIVFFTLFGGVFIFHGNQVVDIEGLKTQDGSIDFNYSTRHFWGLMEFPHRVPGVKHVRIATDSTMKNGRNTLTSELVFMTHNHEESLLSGSSNEQTKKEIRDAINAFYDDSGQTAFSQEFHIRNIFFWVGLPFFTLGILGVIGWPQTIVKAIKKRKNERRQLTRPPENP